MEYTVVEVAAMFDVEPKEISAIVAKGGIKGMRVSPTDTGIEYILNDVSVDQIGAMLGKSPRGEEEDEDDGSIRQAVKDGVIDAITTLEASEFLSSILIKALGSEKFKEQVNNAVYSAVNGVRRQAEREERNNLVPQKW